MRPGVGFLIVDAARLFRREFNALVRETGVTALQHRLLAYARNRAIRQSQLAEILEVEPITISHMSARLREAGLITRHADAADRRVHGLHLSHDGELVVARMRSVVEEVSRTALEAL